MRTELDVGQKGDGFFASGGFGVYQPPPATGFLRRGQMRSATKSQERFSWNRRLGDSNLSNKIVMHSLCEKI